MADAVYERTSLSCSCIAFVHIGNLSQLFHYKVCSAILLDSSVQRVVSGTLKWSGQNAVNRPQSSLCDVSDVSNGHTAANTKPTADVTCMQQGVGDCDVASWNGDDRLQFVTCGKVFLLKMNAHLAGCVTKTLRLSPKFAYSFISYARHCARKHAIFPVHNVSFNVEAVSVSESCSDIACPLITSTEQNMQKTIFAHQSVVVVMTTPRRLGIDYQWYDHHLIDIKLSVNYQLIK